MEGLNLNWHLALHSIFTWGRPTRPVFRSKYSVFKVFKKESKCCTLQSHQKGPGHKHIKEIQRPPEVASKRTFSRQKKKRYGRFLLNKLTAHNSFDR